jgi:hypothetical protein
MNNTLFKRKTIEENPSDLSFVRGSSTCFNVRESNADAIVAASCFEWFDLQEFRKDLLKHVGAHYDLLVLWSLPDNREADTRIWYEWFRSSVGARLGPEADEMILRVNDFMKHPDYTEVVHAENYSVDRLAHFLRSSSYYRGPVVPMQSVRGEAAAFLSGLSRRSIRLAFRQYAFLGQLR